MQYSLGNASSFQISSEMVAFALCLSFIAVYRELAAAGQIGSREQSCHTLGPFIRFPFQLNNSQPHYDGYPGFALSCTKKNETVLEFPAQVRLVVNDIDYRSQAIELYDPSHCIWRQLLKIPNTLIAPFLFLPNKKDYALFNCSSMITLPYPDMTMIPCLSGPGHQIFAIPSDEPIDALPLVSCMKIQNIPSVHPVLFSQDTELLLKWPKHICGDCETNGKNCRLKNNSSNETECFRDASWPSTTLVNIGYITMAMVPFALCLALVPLGLCHLYNSARKENEFQERIRKYLKDYEAHRPTRYSYSDIKRITNQFKEKLGQGAYGTVYKGKLSNENFVAVKILTSCQGNGEDFINEMKTVSTVHHVNIIRLVGFCADGFIRALVYEYLPNGSLDKCLALTCQNNNFLGWNKVQDIALGIAKGIEYLHQGCHQTILHLDIKPHNILLDINFNPKISDFDLSKFCSKDESNISLTTARGTIGYVAPEVFSRNLGRVSCKSDVYSVGMVFIDMIGGREVTNLDRGNDSNIYFPDWIYNFVDKGEDLRIQIEEDADAKIARKLAVVGLWCIQWHPANRPTMKSVVQMLEKGADELTVPPNPFSSIVDT